MKPESGSSREACAASVPADRGEVNGPSATACAEARFDMLEFGCVACMHAIERGGRRIEGVSTVEVDLGRREIRMRYDGRPEAIVKLRDLVRLLGHDIALRAE